MRLAQVGLSLSLAFTVASAQTARFLIFSATKGYRHESIPDAIHALQTAGPDWSMSFDNTENATDFNDENLAKYDGIVMMMNTDDPKDNIMDDDQQAAFSKYLDKGGNFVAVHSASYCLQNASFYERELGAYFSGHPKRKPTTFLKVEPVHEIVSHVPDQWVIDEELYSFQSDPRRFGAQVILTVDEPPEAGNAKVQGSPHPIAWVQEKGAGADPNSKLIGRSFYSSLGHLNTTWMDATYMEYMMTGIMWTLQGNTTLSTNKDATVGDASGFPYAGRIFHPDPADTDDDASSKKSAATSVRPSLALTAIAGVAFVPLALLSLWA